MIKHLYKFKDLTDGNVAFVLAKNLPEAALLVAKWSVLDVRFIELQEAEKHKNFIETKYKSLEQIEDSELPLFLVNNILPF